MEKKWLNFILIILFIFNLSIFTYARKGKRRFLKEKLLYTLKEKEEIEETGLNVNKKRLNSILK